MMIKKFIFCIGLYLAVISQLAASDDRALFWRAESMQSIVYLFGSIHFADESFYPLRAEVEQAFESSDTLAVEVDMSSPEATASFQHLIQNEGYYRDGQTLRDHISEETYTELLSYLSKMQVPAALVEKQKPGIVVLTLAALQAERTGLDPSMGVDLYFLNKAKERMKITSLETAEQQIRIFLDIKNADLLLRDSFYSLEMLENEMGVLVDAWKRGDEKVIHKLLFDDVLKENSALAVLYDSLYFQRNIKMANSIKQFLAEKGRYFVVVGAGHLIGDKGIVHLLQDAGYSVTRQ